MKSRIVTLADLTDVDFRHWRDLADRAIEPNAFLDPRLVAPGGHVHETAKQMRFLFVEDQGQLLAVMHFDVETRRVLRLPMRVLTLGDWDYSSRRYPLIAPERPVETLKALLRPPRALRLPRMIEFPFFPAGGPLNDAFLAAAAELKVRVQEGARVEYAYQTRGSSDGVQAEADGSNGSDGIPISARIMLTHLSPVNRKRFTKRMRDLEAYCNAPLTFADRGNDPAAIREFLDLQAAGWKGDVSKDGAAFRVTGDEEWFIEATDELRAEGRLSVFTLSAGTRAIYMAVRLHSGGGIFAAQDVYDEEYSAFRLGSLGRLSVLEHGLTLTGARFYDPNMRPTYVESSRLYPDRRPYIDYVVASRVLLSSIALGRAIINHLRAMSRRNR